MNDQAMFSTSTVIPIISFAIAVGWFTCVAIHTAIERIHDWRQPACLAVVCLGWVIVLLIFFGKAQP